MPKIKVGFTKLLGQQSGFTLVEVLVALGILAILAAASIPNLRKFNQGQELDSTSSMLTRSLRTAQSGAMSKVTCPNNQPSATWQVVIDPTAGNFATYCQNSSDLSLVSVFQLTYPGNIKISSDSCDVAGVTTKATMNFNFNSISFSCTNGNIISSAIFSITFQDSRTGATKMINIDQGGAIYEN